jgi:hypothetical protein
VPPAGSPVPLMSTLMAAATGRLLFQHVDIVAPMDLLAASVCPLILRFAEACIPEKYLSNHDQIYMYNVYVHVHVAIAMANINYKEIPNK